jgi:hypothetical protein
MPITLLLNRGAGELASDTDQGALGEVIGGRSRVALPAPTSTNTVSLGRWFTARCISRTWWPEAVTTSRAGHLVVAWSGSRLLMSDLLRSSGRGRCRAGWSLDADDAGSRHLGRTRVDTGRAEPIEAGDAGLVEVPDPQLGALGVNAEATPAVLDEQATQVGIEAD